MSETTAMPTSESLGSQTFRLIYRSRCTIPESSRRAELANILRVSRANNKASGVSGALLMYEEWFAQVLEGPEAAVHGVYGRIKADTRHDSLHVVEERQVSARAFPRWAMADVGDHGEADIPLVATQAGLAEAAPWLPGTPEQTAVLNLLRDLTRGYGR